MFEDVASCILDGQEFLGYGRKPSTGVGRVVRYIYLPCHLASECCDRYPYLQRDNRALPLLSLSDPSSPSPVHDPLTYNHHIQFIPLCSL